MGRQGEAGEAGEAGDADEAREAGEARAPTESTGCGWRSGGVEVQERVTEAGEAAQLLGTPWRPLPTKPRTGSSPLLSCSVSALLLSLPAPHEATQTALLAGPHGEELRPPAKSQENTETPRQQPCEYTILEIDPLTPSQAFT